jgi:osmotically inducible protein OsmC
LSDVSSPPPATRITEATALAAAERREALSAGHDARRRQGTRRRRHAMPTRNAHAEWNGSIGEGGGTMALGSGAFEGPYSFKSRMEDGAGTNPEELIGAAHAGCFSMALSVVLGAGGHDPESIKTDAKVHFVKEGDGFTIKGIDLTTRGRVPGLDNDGFVEAAQAAKENCPVSKALTGTEITLDAALEG